MEKIQSNPVEDAKKLILEEEKKNKAAAWEKLNAFLDNEIGYDIVCEFIVSPVRGIVPMYDLVKKAK